MLGEYTGCFGPGGLDLGHLLFTGIVWEHQLPSPTPTPYLETLGPVGSCRRSPKLREEKALGLCEAEFDSVLSPAKKYLPSK